MPPPPWLRRGRGGLGGGAQASLAEVGGVGETGGVAADDPDAGAAVAAAGDLLDAAVVERRRGGPLVLCVHLGELGAGAHCDREHSFQHVLVDHAGSLPTSLRRAGTAAAWPRQSRSVVVPPLFTLRPSGDSTVATSPRGAAWPNRRLTAHGTAPPTTAHIASASGGGSDVAAGAITPADSRPPAAATTAKDRHDRGEPTTADGATTTAATNAATTGPTATTAGVAVHGRQQTPRRPRSRPT